MIEFIEPIAWCLLMMAVSFMALLLFTAFQSHEIRKIRKRVGDLESELAHRDPEDPFGDLN